MKKQKPTHLLNPDIKAHIRDLNKFVNSISAYGENPESWPLTHQEQVAFVRTAVYQARKLKCSAGFVLTEVLITSEDLVMAS